MQSAYLNSTKFLVAALFLGAHSLTVFAQDSQDGGVDYTILDEIIVTARKRSENVLDVPTSITALSAVDIANRNYRGLDDLRLAAPNVYIEEGLGGNSTASIYIRGLGQINPSFFFDAPVAIYSDGVYYARNAGALVDFADVERIEILRGPQGTLFGRNASAGAIRIISQRPPVDKRDFLAQIGFGTENQINTRFSFGTPLIDGTSALRIAASTKKNDGFQTNTTLGNKAYTDDAITAAVTYLHNLSDKGSVRIRWEYLNDDSISPGSVDILNDADNDKSTFESNFDDTAAYHTVDTQALSATLEYDFGAVSLTSISAFRELTETGAADGDGSANVGVFENQGQLLDQQQFTQEIYFSGGSKVFWIGGVYYIHEKNLSTFALQILPFFPQFNNLYTQTTDSIAAYGELTFPITDMFEVSAGLRYTDEEKDFFGDLMDGTFQDIFSEDRVDWSLSAKWDLSDNSNVYLSSGTSFRSGGFNGGAFFVGDVTAGAFATEEVFNVEAGYKASLLDRRVRLNVAIFSSTYKNMQVAVIDSNATILNTNADVDLTGIEFELTAQATSNLELFTNIGTINSDIIVQSTFTADELPRAPDITAQLGFMYSIPSAVGDFRVGVDYRYTDDYFVGREEETKVKAFGMINASLSYTTRSEKWTFSLNGTNLSDEDYNLSAFFIPGLVTVRAPNQPRRWLASAQYSF